MCTNTGTTFQNLSIDHVYYRKRQTFSSRKEKRREERRGDKKEQEEGGAEYTQIIHRHTRNERFYMLRQAPMCNTNYKQHSKGS